MNRKAETVERQLAHQEEVELIGDSTKTEIVARLEEELGYRLCPDLMHLIDIVPDPWLVGTFAMRFQNPSQDDDAAYFLLTPDGLEQVDYTCWPPNAL